MLKAKITLKLQKVKDNFAFFLTLAVLKAVVSIQKAGISSFIGASSSTVLMNAVGISVNMILKYFPGADPISTALSLGSSKPHEAQVAITDVRGRVLWQWNT